MGLDIRHICTNSRTGSAGARTCPSLPAPDPAAAPANTRMFAPGGARTGWVFWGSVSGQFEDGTGGGSGLGVAVLAQS